MKEKRKIERPDIPSPNKKEKENHEIAVNEAPREKIKGEICKRWRLVNCEWCSCGNCYEMREYMLSRNEFTWRSTSSGIEDNSSQVESVFKVTFFEFLQRNSAVPRQIYFTLLIEWCSVIIETANRTINKQGKSVMLDVFANCNDLCQLTVATSRRTMHIS